MIDFTQKEQADILKLVDNWADVDNIAFILKARSLMDSVNKLELSHEINRLKNAAFRYPDLDYHEALQTAILNNDDLELVVYPYLRPADKTYTIARCCNNEPPSQDMLELLKTGGFAVAKWVLSGFKLVTREQQDTRLAVCEQCEFLFKEQVRCTKCGCFVKIKAWMATEDCPLNKWSEVQ